MRYEIVARETSFELRMYNDVLGKVASIVFEQEIHAREYGEDFLKGENQIKWELQDDITN